MFKISHQYSFIILYILLLLSSCINYRIQVPAQKGIKGYDGNNGDTILKIAIVNKSRLQEYDLNGHHSQSEVPWGLAMSGGGIRSAFINIGVLKALYDSKMLSSINIISSVSGGSYASGWFYSREIENISDTIGKTTLDDNYILSHLCDLQNYANTYKTQSMLASFFLSPKKAFNNYKKRITRSFLPTTFTNKDITQFQNRILSKSLPNFIINTTVSSQKNNDWLSTVFEYTPFYRGNPEIGFEKFDSFNSVSLDTAITISAAAIKSKLMMKTQNYSPGISSPFIPLSDGGHSENLGAVSLIQRGTKNIIIVDAEYDKNYEFGAYLSLKKYLKKELHLNLSIPTIESFLSTNQDTLLTGMHAGNIESLYIQPDHINKPVKINIFYIKMALPKSINNLLANTVNYNKGNALQETIFYNSCEKFFSDSSDCSLYKDPCNLSSILLQKNDFSHLSVYWVKSYSDYLKRSRWKNNSYYQFPQITTSDQSFYRNQARAFIGLGYLEGLELRKIFFVD